MISVLTLAAVDRRLRHRAFRILVYVARDGTPREFRLLKHSVLARALGIDRADVAHDMTTLTELGYLELGPMDGKIRRYRVAQLPLTLPHESAMCGVLPQCRTA